MEELKSFNEVFSMAAKGIQNAIVEYGPEAVELGLMVYRLEGVKVIGAGALILLFSFAIFYVTYFFTVRWITPKVKQDKYLSDLYTFTAMALVVNFPVFLWGLSKLLSVYHWAAALGYPEVLIAHKALQAAGLM